jgi:hypothetical protein
VTEISQKCKKLSQNNNRPLIKRKNSIEEHFAGTARINGTGVKRNSK